MADLAEIRAYYRKVAGPSVSTRVLARIRKTLSGIERMPRSGSLREEFGEDVRLHLAGPYVIYANVSGERVVILRILHAARDRDALIRGD